MDLHLSFPATFSCSDIDSSCSFLFSSTNNDIIELIKLSVSNLLIESFIGEIKLDLDAFLMESLEDLGAVIVELLRKRTDEDLPRTDKVGPLACEMLNKNSHEPFD